VMLETNDDDGQTLTELLLTGTKDRGAAGATPFDRAPGPIPSL
jgi:hypothetical protein